MASDILVDQDGNSWCFNNIETIKFNPIMDVKKNLPLSYKHAFQNKEDGKILITLSQEKSGLLKLNIADNGQTSENELNVKKEKGFGSLLIQLLTTQLGGKLEKSTEAGTSTIIEFPIQEKSAA